MHPLHLQQARRLIGVVTMLYCHLIEMVDLTAMMTTYFLLTWGFLQFVALNGLGLYSGGFGSQTAAHYPRRKAAVSLGICFCASL